MIFEFLSCLGELPYARFGWKPLAEQAAIRARYRRHAPLWGTHLAICRDILRQTSLLSAGTDLAVILGSGLLLDVPVGDLCGRFRRVRLVDLHHPLAARLAARRHRNLELCYADVTSDDFWRESSASADFLVSVNLAAQLAVQASDPLPALRHIARMQSASGVRLMISELARVELDGEGRELAREDALPLAALAEPPEKNWKWYLAPPGELAPYRGLALEVGAWIWSAQE